MNRKEWCYILITVLVIVLIYLLCNNKNEQYNVKSSQYCKEKSKKCAEQQAELICGKKYMPLAFQELQTTVTNNTNDKNLINYVDNLVTCEQEFFTNNLSLNDAKKQLQTCMNNVNNTNKTGQRLFYELQGNNQAVQTAVNNLNFNNNLNNCIKNYPNML